jgi:tripartite-type tricarboxylate transporter receptor subunit TctC
MGVRNGVWDEVVHGEHEDIARMAQTMAAKVRGSRERSVFGASGLIGTKAAAKSPPDGYTFLVAAATSIVTVPLLRKVRYDQKAEKFRAEETKSIAELIRIADIKLE